MVKKISTVNIDEDVLKLAKKEIPNLSGFIENCLRVYLGIDNNVKDIQDELNTIKQCQLNIYLMSKGEFKQKQVQEFDDKKLNDAWLKIWAVYRNTEVINDAGLVEAEKVLGKTFDLEDMMNTLLLYVPKSEIGKCDSWDYAVKQYEDIINGVSDYV